MTEDIEYKKRYIEVSELPNLEVTCSNGKSYILLPFEHLYDIPTADVAEVRYGEWIFNSHQAYGEPSYFCSLCVGDRGSETGQDNYCPDCGAKMNGNGD